MVWETFGKHKPARWQQSFSNASDPLVFPEAFLENDLKIQGLLAALAVVSVVAMAATVAVASLNDLKIQLRKFLLSVSQCHYFNIFNNLDNDFFTRY